MDACCQTLVAVRKFGPQYYICMINKNIILYHTSELFSICREDTTCTTPLFPEYFNHRGFKMAELQVKRKDIEVQTKISMYTAERQVRYQEIYIGTLLTLEPRHITREEERGKRYTQNM